MSELNTEYLEILTKARIEAAVAAERQRFIRLIEQVSVPKRDGLEWHRRPVDLIKLVDENEMQQLDRFQVIDETGSAYYKTGVKVTLSYQDNGKTLKVFLD